MSEHNLRGETKLYCSCTADTYTFLGNCPCRCRQVLPVFLYAALCCTKASRAAVHACMHEGHQKHNFKLVVLFHRLVTIHIMSTSFQQVLLSTLHVYIKIEADGKQSCCKIIAPSMKSMLG